MDDAMAMQGMNDIVAIPFGFVAQKSSDPEIDAPDHSKPPASYGKILEREREAAKLSRKAFAKEAGLTEVTVWRNETGHKSRSVKAMAAMRAKLIELGRDVPPVPIGDAAAAPHAMSKLSADAERIRWNLIRFREALDLDQASAAYVTKIPQRTLMRFEAGDDEPSGSELSQIARAFGCKLGDFEIDEDAPSPPLKLSTENDVAARYNRLVGVATEEELAEIERVMAPLRTRAKAQQQGASPRPPRRRPAKR